MDFRNASGFSTLVLDEPIPPTDEYIPFCTARVENSVWSGLVLIHNASREYELLKNTPATANL